MAARWLVVAGTGTGSGRGAANYLSVTVCCTVAAVILIHACNMPYYTITIIYSACCECTYSMRYGYHQVSNISTGLFGRRVCVEILFKKHF